MNRRLFVRYIDGYTLSPHTLHNKIPFPPKPLKQNTLLILGSRIWPEKLRWMPSFLNYFQAGFGHIIMEDRHAAILQSGHRVHTITEHTSVILPWARTMVHHHHPSIPFDSFMAKIMTHAKNNEEDMRHIIVSTDPTPVPLVWSISMRQPCPSFLWLASGPRSIYYRTSPFYNRFHVIWSNHMMDTPHFHPSRVFDMSSGTFLSEKI